MIVDNEEQDGIKADPNTATGEGTTAAGNRPVLNIDSMMSHYSAQNVWTAESLDYINNIRKILEDDSRSFRITAKQFGNNAYIFTNNDVSVIILMDSDSQLNPYELIKETAIRQVAEKFKEINSASKLADIITCNKYMFNRYTQMAVHIEHQIKAGLDTSAKHLTIQSFTQQADKKLTIDTDVNSVRAFMAKNSTNGASCCDFGFLCRLTQASNKNRDELGEVLFGVSAYVEFVNEVNPITNASQYTPLVHVTEIISAIPNRRMLGLIMSLIPEIFISKGLWRQQFTAQGNTNINIGNLVIHPDNGQPWNAENERDIEAVFTTDLTKDNSGRIATHLVIDYAPGQACIPGLSALASKSQKTLMQEIGDFYGDPNTFAGMETMAFPVMQEIVGIAEISDKVKATSIMDTRDINYLWACGTLGYNEQVSQLKQRYPDPTTRFRLIQEMVGNVLPTHRVLNLLINGAVASRCSQIVSNYVNVSIPIADTIPAISFADHTSNLYQSAAGFSSGGSGMSFNTTNWY